MLGTLALSRARGVLQRVAACCSALQCVYKYMYWTLSIPLTMLETLALSRARTVWCSALSCVAVCCGVLQCVAVCCSTFTSTYTRHFQSHWPCWRLLLSLARAVCRTVLHCIALCCTMLQCVAVCLQVHVYDTFNPNNHTRDSCSVSRARCVAACCSMLQCISVCLQVQPCCIQSVIQSQSPISISLVSLQRNMTKET